MEGEQAAIQHRRGGQGGSYKEQWGRGASDRRVPTAMRCEQSPAILVSVAHRDVGLCTFLYGFWEAHAQTQKALRCEMDIVVSPTLMSSLRSFSYPLALAAGLQQPSAQVLYTLPSHRCQVNLSMAPCSPGLSLGVQPLSVALNDLP